MRVVGSRAGVKQFHSDFNDVTKDLHVLVTPQTRTVKSSEESQPDKEILSPNTVLAVILQLMSFAHLRWVGFTEKRPYSYHNCKLAMNPNLSSLQYILSDVKEYERFFGISFDMLALSQELSLDDLLEHYKLSREQFLESLNYHASKDKEFFEMYNRISHEYPRYKPDKKHIEVTESQAVEMLDRLIRYASECTHDPTDMSLRDNFRKNYTADRYYLDYKVDISDYDLREEKMTPAAREKLLEFRAALVIAH